MTADVNRRLSKLESERGPSFGCAECGGPPPKGAKVEYEVVWEDDEILEDQEDLGPTHCPSCHRVLIIEVHWPEDPREEQAKNDGYPGPQWKDRPGGRG